MGGLQRFGGAFSVQKIKYEIFTCLKSSGFMTSVNDLPNLFKTFDN
jgi:hypothetical protein